MFSKRFVIYLTTMTTVFLLAISSVVAADSVSRMSTDELKSRLGEADLVVLDVRGSWDWVGAVDKVAGSDRVEPGGVSQWASHYEKDKTIVLYCA